jgi:ATP-binding cassette subfamily C protein
MEWLSVLALLAIVLILLGASEPQQSLLGMVALLAVAMARLKGSVTGLLGAYAQVQTGVVSVDVVDRDLRELETIRHFPPKMRDRVSPGPLRLADAIHLDDVWFRYAGSADWVLRGITLAIRRGEAVGFVGPSGGGKSTLVDVILGVLRPERGTVTVDGTQIGEDLAAWQRNVGYIPQSIYLIEGTIRQNIALGLEDKAIDDAAVARAMTAASLEDFVTSLPEGINTLVGERGVRLSGGQRQRIAIARALYYDPDVLIMDEATAALDNLTEKAVMEAVEALKGERTILMIAHRLSTVRNCDRIEFLRDGEITGEGRYDDLVASHVEFASIANVH